MTEELLAKLQEQVSWFGAALADIGTAQSVIDAGPSMTLEEVQRELDFYHGRQWPEHVLKLRTAQSPPRPTLVVNRLPEIVSAALDKQRAVGLPELSQSFLYLLEAIVTRQNRDAQVLYNYLLSALVESHEGIREK